MERAKQAAGQIFSSYPDYGKAPKEYLASVIEFLALMPDYVVARMADRLTGIAAQSQYLPTIAELKAFADKAMEAHAKEIRYSNLQNRRPDLPALKSPFRPYPRLWEAFRGEQHVLKILDAAVSFDFLTEASKRFAVRGKDEARKFICAQPVDARETSEQAA